MRRFLYIICVCFFGFNCYADVNIFDAKEVYIGFYPADNYANVIEYDVLYDNKSSTIKDDVNSLITTIKDANYSSSKYGYKFFKSAEEFISNEGKYAKINLDLINCNNVNMQTIEDLFSKTLKTNVVVKIENNKINMYFDGSNIELRSYNAENGYAKGNQILLSWPTSLNKMELVFARNNNNSESIIPYFEGKISSPELSKEEVDYLKNSSPALDEKEQKYQDDCDIVRLQHLAYYGKLIEEYKSKVGKYPFEGENQQVYAFVHNKKQKKYCKDTNPYKHKQIAPKDFFEELERGLGRQIEQLFDPQYVPSGRPIFYIYMIDGNQYFFAVHLSKYYSFSKKVDSNYYKVELSNISDSSYKIYTIEQLESDEKFKEAMSKKFGGYFELRKKQHIREYK